MKVASALLRAAAAHDLAFMVRPLILLGANPFDTGDEGRTAFNCAASNGLNALAVLTEIAFRDTQKPEGQRRWKDCGLNTPSGRYGSTLITYAAKVCPANLVKEIIAAGADIGIVNGSGWTLLHCAAVMPGRAQVIDILFDAFHKSGLSRLTETLTTHVYDTDYNGRHVSYPAGLTAAGLCRARIAQDPGCPPELKEYPAILDGSAT